MQGKQIGEHCQLQVYTTESTEAWDDTQHYYHATDHLNARKPALHCKPRQRGTVRTAIHPRLLRDK